MAMSSSSHTVTLMYTMHVDIHALIKKSKGKRIERRSLKQLDAENLLRTKRSGFSYKRYVNANIKFPLLITGNNVLIDGRHRLCRLFDSGAKFANVIVMDRKEICECEVK